MIDAVIFDLGNVLAFHDNALLYRELGALFGRPLKDLPKGLWDRAMRGQLPADALRLELAALLGRAPPREDFERAWSCHFTVNQPMVHLAQRLVGRAKLVLLSNTHDLHVAHLRPLLPVLERFDALVLSCEVGHLKPEPEIYALALAAAQVPAHRAVFFDDVEAYVDAARLVGLHAHVFRQAADVPLQLATLGLVL